jgi:CxxC-x17-CxxC domain-containing protein
MQSRRAGKPRTRGPSSPAGERVIALRACQSSDRREKTPFLTARGTMAEREVEPFRRALATSPPRSPRALLVLPATRSHPLHGAYPPHVERAPMSDQQITCAECGNVFLFSAAEQQFYTERGLASPPKRCKGCRQARRASQGDGGGRGPSRDSRDRGAGPPRFGGGDRGGRRPDGGGGPSDYRSPGGGNGGYRGAGGGDARFAPRPDWGGAGGAPNNGLPPGRGDRGAPRGARGDRPPRPGGFGGGGFNRDARPAPAARSGHEGRPAWGSRPGEERPRPPRAEPSAEAEPAAARPAARARPERPRYDITCAECGAQAQVPFKPLEGRQVFCQPCYRARKGTPEVADAAVTTDSDNGIVE